MNKIPNFFIVGGPKCGTTAMNQYLGQHPDIFMAQKELHFFSSDLKLKYHISENEYLDYFQGVKNEKIVGEASVWYLFSEMAAQAIKAFSPEAKILIMLRNPIEVIHALHSQHLYDGNENVRDFAKALRMDESRKKGLNMPESLEYLELPPYLTSVLFSGQVKRYLDVFGERNVFIILYDDFVTDSKKVLYETMEFLGLNPQTDMETKIINPNKRIINLYLHRILKNPSPLLKKFVRLILPVKRIRHEMMKTLFSLNKRIAKRDNLDENLMVKLKLELSGDIKELSQIINRDLSAWL